MLLPSRAQIILFWGPEFVVLYNDAYRPVFGGKHPSALGLPGREAWGEIWQEQLRPLLQGVVDTGEAFWATDLLFLVQRHGYLEETYFDISYDPVRDETGKVAGVYCIVTETTARVSGERRLRTLSSLGRVGLRAHTVSGVLQAAAQVLGENREDIAFALLYEWDAAHRVALLRATSGVNAGHPAAVEEVSTGPGSPWPLDAKLPPEGVVLEASKLSLDARLPGGRWPEPCTRIAVLPIAMPGQAPDGFLVAGLSPRRVIDNAYRDFLRLVTAGLGGALSNARALEAERRRVDALADLDRAKTAFLSNVSHEFRTPLTLLLGPLRDELGAEAIPERSRERLEVAYRNGVRLLKLVNALLDFSRIEVGRMQARFEATDIGTFTRDLASSFESAFHEAGLKLNVRSHALDGTVFVDRDKWEKVVLNLLSNALKFTFEGGVEVRVAQEGERAVLSVRDSGVGIDPAEMPRLFERFHRIEGARSRSHEGSGIGLAMVQELVKMHGGEIGVQSQPGQGSVFTVSIPLGRDHLPADQVVAESSTPPAMRHADAFLHEVDSWLRTSAASDPDVTPSEAATPRERVLVADDNADMREYVKGLLAEHWDVVAVPDGEAAMGALFTARFDLIVADVMMPKMDGFALLKAVRSDPSLRDLPVLMLSARAGEEANIDGRAAGADDYLVKPFSARELIARVKAQLTSAASRRAVAREREARMDAQRLREDLTRLFEQAPNPMVILRGPEHMIELANPAACQVWGRTPEQVLRRPLFDVLPELRGQEVRELLDEVLSTGKPYHGRRLAVQIDRGSGPEDVYFDFVYSPLRAVGGRVEGVAVTAFDVTRDVIAPEEPAAAD
jgi:PAS domain S-box-containing protein